MYLPERLQRWFRISCLLPYQIQNTEVLQAVSLPAYVRTAVSMLSVTLGDNKGMKVLESLPTAGTLELETQGSSKILGKGGESLTELLSSV